MTEKNALAELAECLSNDAEYLYGNNDKASEDVSKAQRIVAELAKVEDRHDKVGYPHNFQKESPHIRGYCHEITTAIKKCFDALSAPPRNCDVLSKDEVLETLKDRSFSKEE